MDKFIGRRRSDTTSVPARVGASRSGMMNSGSTSSGNLSASASASSSNSVRPLQSAFTNSGIQQRKSLPSARVAAPTETPAKPSAFRYSSSISASNSISSGLQSAAGLVPLGAGQFSCVFRTKDNKSAVKRSRRPFNGAADRQAQYAEPRALALLAGHVNIVQLERVWELDSFLYIQTELCSLGDLEKYLGSHPPLDELCAIKILASVINGLQFIHSHDMVHGDIKPANIFIHSSGQLKIGDFGIAFTATEESDESMSDSNIFSRKDHTKPNGGSISFSSSISDSFDSISDTSSGKNRRSSHEMHPIEGDRRYLAPEALTSRPTQASDIFSVGLLTLEIACNLLLPHNSEPWHRLRNGDLSDCPPVVYSYTDTIIRAMLQPEPSKRPTAANMYTDSPPIAFAVDKMRSPLQPPRDEDASTLRQFKKLLTGLDSIETDVPEIEMTQLATTPT